jgi:hypothetical protein
VPPTWGKDANVLGAVKHKPLSRARVRGRPDAMIGGALVVDCVRASDAAALRARLAAINCRKMLGLDHPPDVGTYAFVCFLENAG